MHTYILVHASCTVRPGGDRYRIISSGLGLEIGRFWPRLCIDIWYISTGTIFFFFLFFFLFSFSSPPGVVGVGTVSVSPLST